MISAIRLTGVEAPRVIDGAMDSRVFRGCVERLRGPTLHAGDIVVLDNLSSHQAAGVREAIEARDASLLDLPPYSPDLNPIEAMGSKVKQSLRGAAARTSHALLRAIGDALRSVTLDDCRGFFQGCGYVATQ